MFNSQFSELRNIKISRTACSFLDSAPTVRSVDTTSAKGPLAHPLRVWNLFAQDINGDLVFLSTTASFFDFGAVRVAENIVKHMTKAERALKGFRKHALVFAFEYLPDS
jgi:hypothetical protein